MTPITASTAFCPFMPILVGDSHKLFKRLVILSYEQVRHTQATWGLGDPSLQYTRFVDSVTEPQSICCNEVMNEKEYFSLKSSVVKPNTSVWSVTVDCPTVTYNKSMAVIFWSSLHSPSAAWSKFAIHRPLCSTPKKRGYPDALYTSVISRPSQPVHWNFPNRQIICFH